MADEENDMPLLSHPFRLERSGAAATVLDGTDRAHGEAIAVLALTRRGERPLVPDFGIPDPSFEPDLDLAELNVALALFGPAVTVTNLELVAVSDRAMRVEITYDDDEE